MDWNRIRTQWQATAADAAPEDVLRQVQARDAALRRQLKRRDLLETVVAIAIAPFFAGVAWWAADRGAWLPAFFAVAIVAWVLFVPLHLWRVRRALPDARPDLPLVDYLSAERTAMQAQARMLERIWFWYLGPCAFGIAGLTLSVRGPTPGALGYLAVVGALFALIAWANRHAARTQFGALADQIDEQISNLTRE